LQAGAQTNVNNIYVNEVNLGNSGHEFLHSLPLERVEQVHLAGYEDRGGFLVDAHNNRVSASVWALFAELQTLKSGIPALVEWDNDLPELEVLLDEAARAETYMTVTDAEAA